jgi:serine/threonine protein kinase
MYHKTSEVIGEGTYGCVHSPSLTCKDSPNMIYNNKVSKILKKSDATIELNEYNKLKDADTHDEFYLGIPDKCEIDYDIELNKKAIEKCQIGKDVLRKMDQYKLIIMGDGGINLMNYSDNLSKLPISDISKEKCELFLLETLRLFKGLKVFEKNGLIHHDLKPQNIVYNEKTNRLNFIDFGLMVSRNKIIKEASAGKYNFAIFHWSFPWELEFINSVSFRDLYNNPRNQDNQVNTVKHELEQRKGNYYDHASNFFYFALDKNSTMSKYKQDCADYFLGYERTIYNNGKELKYKKFVDSSVRTIDVFGLGITLNYWFHSAKKHLPQEIVTDLNILYAKMIEPELVRRPHINELLDEMKHILLSSGLLEKYNKKIIDYLVVNANVKTPSLKIKMPDSQIFNKIDKPNEEIINTTPTPCPEGEKRNKMGDCVKIKQKLHYNVILPCPPGKERNPKTRRCVNICKPGYTRDENFKCIKNKTKKL